MQKTTKPKPVCIQSILEEELNGLKRAIPYDGINAVDWQPRPNGNLSGEVHGDTIQIYEESPQEAIKTLDHEYLDCVLTKKIVDPLIQIINLLIKAKADEVYTEKEIIIDRLMKLLELKPKE